MDHETAGLGPPTIGVLLRPDLGRASVLAWLVVILLAAYLSGVRRLLRRGDRWPIWSTLAFAAGCLSVLAVTATGVQVYGMALFSAHMVQHMVLSMLSPILLLLGAPVTLALRALPAGRGTDGAPRRLLLRGLHSRAGRVLAHPGFTVPLFVASLYGVYFTPLFDLLMSSATGHALMLTHFLVAGLLFFGPVLAVDPWPHRSGHAMRMLELLLPMPFHAFFGVVVMMSGGLLFGAFADPPAAWGIDPAADQRMGGGIAWAFGEIPTLAVLAVIFVQWARSEERASRVTERAWAQERTVEVDHELDAYNEYLGRLAAQESARLAARDALRSPAREPAGPSGLDPARPPARDTTSKHRS